MECILARFRRAFPGKKSVRHPVVEAPAASFDYYISTTGSDSNDGSLGSPWAITAINTKAATYAGKRVGLLDGTYGLYALAFPNIFYSEALLNIAGGIDADNPTIIEAANLHGAILDGSENNAGLVFLNGGESPGGALIGAIGSDRSHVKIKGLRIRNHFGTAVTMAHTASDGHSVLSKISNVSVENCWIHDINGNIDGNDSSNNTCAVAFFHVTGGLFKNNYVHDVSGGNLTQVTHTTSLLWWDVHDSVIEYNTFKMCPNPIMLKGAANKSPTIRFNYMKTDPAREDVGIRSDVGQSGGATYIHNNVIDCITAIAYSVEAFRTQETHIYNNTFVEVNQSGIVHHQVSNASQWFRFYNNILNRSEASIPGGDFEICEDSWAVLNYNCYSPNNFNARTHPENDSSSGSVTWYTSFASWQTRVQSSLAGAEDDSFQDDPEFVGTGTDAAKYVLQGTSPCLTTGASGQQMGAWGGASPPTQIGKDF